MTTAMKVELIYEKTCPNIEAAREQLLLAFADTGIDAQWQEWEVSAEDTPNDVRGYGSPTILVNGVDIADDEQNTNSCRVYAVAGGGFTGVPPLDKIKNALQANMKNNPKKWKLNTAMLPSLGAALLPKLTCPACWPAYAGLLSSFGIGFFDYTPYLLPLTSVFLLLALGALWYRAEKRRGYKPLFLGIGASLILLVGKFFYDSDIFMYIGLGFLVTASVWNTWPRKTAGENIACPNCVTK